MVYQFFFKYDFQTEYSKYMQQILQLKNWWIC